MSHPGFTLETATPVASLGLELRQYRHAGTGARHFHLACADGNNAFMVALPTLPQDSTGVAHILEHTTLCGSQRYPVRDPFFMMLRRSLNTFMNAFTSGDSTAYPFATQNRKDFDNLLEVYLDAVFFPRLDPRDFAQEGWRLEFAPDGRGLEYHGVVYNEMKGAMSAPLAQLWQHVHAALFPDTVYRHNSGGDPLVIPQLTHAALRAFHARHYHPGNAVFMTYGNFPEQDHQRLIETRVLHRFGSPADTLVSAPQPPFATPRGVHAVYHVDADTPRATHLVWAWVVGENADAESAIAAQVLSSILLEHGASPLRHLLETTPLADAPSELCGVDDSARQLVFLCGVEGSEVAHAEALERDIFTLLEQVATHGIAAAALAAIVDRLELAQRDIDGGSYPFGLTLMGRLLPAALYRRDPAPLLDLEPALARLRHALEAPDYVAGLVRRLLLDNPHRVRVVMSPELDKAARDAAVEQTRLAALAAQLDEAGRAALAAASAALRARQAEVDDVDLLPRVTLADVPPAAPAPVPRVAPAGVGEACEYACAANGVFRVQFVYDLPALDAQSLNALPLFAEYLTEFGHEGRDYLAVQAARALVGSFGAHVVVRSALTDSARLAGWLVIGAKGLARKRDALIDQAGCVLAGVRLDEGDRLRELLMQARAEAEQSVADRGHQLAVLTAARSFTPGAALDEAWDGPSAIRQLKALGAANVDGDTLDQVFATFARLREALLTAPRRVLLIGEDAALAGAADRAAPHLAAGAGAWQAFTAPALAAPAPTNWITSAQVNFCAKAYAAVPEADPDAATLAVLGRYLQDGFLHGAIREQGGAYGSGAGYDADSGTFRFFSYRDPRAAATLADFDRALEWFAGDRDARRLEESILGTVRALDQPRSAPAAAERAFLDRLHGRDDSFRGRFRARVLGTDHAALQAAAARHLVPGRGRIGVLSSAASQAEFASLGLAFDKL